MDKDVRQRKYSTLPLTGVRRTMITGKDRGVYLQHSLSSVHRLGTQRALYTPSSWGSLTLPYLYTVWPQRGDALSSDELCFLKELSFQLNMLYCFTRHLLEERTTAFH